MLSWCEPYFVRFLTVVNTFLLVFQEKYFLSFVIPPFHLGIVITLIINSLCKVELWVEYGWNYMKFHPYSTHNSTLYNTLNIKHIAFLRWKGGTSFAIKIFKRIIAEKLWRYVNFGRFWMKTTQSVSPNQSSTKGVNYCRQESCSSQRNFTALGSVRSNTQ